MSSEGISEVVVTLESIGGSENGPVLFAKPRKLGTDWHALCYCVQLVLACLASYPGLFTIAFSACGTQKVSRLYERQTLG